MTTTLTVLFLGPPESLILRAIRTHQEPVHITALSDPLTASELARIAPNVVVSHGYRHILTRDLLAPVVGRSFFNCHISYLPWNRGAHPNVWSAYEGTPAGVTIHLIDPGIDTGPIVAQRRVSFQPDDTLRTSYDALQHAMCDLFDRSWPMLIFGKYDALPQPPGGSYHRMRDLDVLWPRLPHGWDTALAYVRQLGSMEGVLLEKQ